MTIDAHQHFWKYNPVRDAWIDASMKRIQNDFLPEDLELIFIENNVDGCVAVQADQSEEETQFLLQLADENTFIKGVVGWVDLLSDAIEERLMHFSKHPKFKGVRHILQAEHKDFMLRKDFKNGISKLSGFGLTYDILVFPHQLKNTIRLVEQFPEQNFVLDHLGKPYIKDGKIKQWAEDISVLASFENVSCKLSGMVTETDWKHWQPGDFTPYLNIIFEAFGTRRLLFASDWPVCLLAGEYSDIKSIITDYVADFSVEEQQQLMGDNALDFYNLNH